MRDGGQVILRHETSYHGQRLLSSKSANSTSNNLTIGELAGETTAECAAVCCCPCGFAFLLILALCKYPGKMCRTLLRKRKLRRLVRMRRDALLAPGQRRRCSFGEMLVDRVRGLAAEEEMEMVMDGTRQKEVMELEKEMWDEFQNTGFWRSHSQRVGYVEDQMIPCD